MSKNKDVNGYGLDLIVSWRDRLEIEQALPSLHRCALRHRGGVTIVNFGGDGEHLSEMVRRAGAPVKVVSVRDQLYFNKAKAQNIGAGSTNRGVLFFCDCDIVLPEAALDELFELVAMDANHFGTIAGVSETVKNARSAGNVVMFGYHLKVRIANGRMLNIVDNEEDADDGTRQAPGLLMVHRANFESIGGYNGRLHGWGWEDQDMISRLTLGAGLERVQRGYAKHISHGDEARIRHYPPVKDRWESRDRMFRQALENYDRNDFQGTFHQDVRDLSSVCATHHIDVQLS